MKILDVQQRSEEWFKARLGVITGSRAIGVFKSNNLALIDEMIAERMTQTIEESFTSKAMQHGVLFEPEALKAYNELTKNSAQEIGFCVHDKYEWLAISPDALIFRDNTAVGAVEIKCPSSKKHVEYIRKNSIPAEYKYQIFHYFIVIETLQFLDFCTYDPRNPIKKTHIVRVTREEIKEELEEVFAEYMKFYAKLVKYEEQINSRV